MTQEEEDKDLILQYLNLHCGKNVKPRVMLNELVKYATGYVKDKFHVSRSDKRKAWVRLQRVLTKLRAYGIVKSTRSRQIAKARRTYTIRLNEAYAHKI